MKPRTATWKAIGGVMPLPAPRPPWKPRTITDGIVSEGGTPPSLDSKLVFNFGRHRWLGLVARDAKLPGAAHRIAVLLWQLQNAERGCAWPSLIYIATELNMHKSTVIRSLLKLQIRGWTTKTQRGGRHRSNEYRISFGSMEGGDDAD